MTESKPHVMIGMPCYGNVSPVAMSTFYACASSRGYEIERKVLQSSLLAKGFNTIWAQALWRAKNEGVTHFVMLHSDIAPVMTDDNRGFVDILIDECERLDAHVVSAVSPLKNGQGLTSTGVANPEYPWQPYRRWTMTEIMSFPETFCAEQTNCPDKPLIVNTGCWIADLRKPLFHETNDDGSCKMYFTVNDRIMPGAESDQHKVEVEPEDWFFSRLLYENNAKVYATRKVALRHLGETWYPNQGDWGSEKTDLSADARNGLAVA
jgi:hypothetical protein